MRKEEQLPNTERISHPTRETLTNWSRTHSCRPNVVYRPTSTAEVSAAIRQCHSNGTRVRIVGSGLSPNGIGFSDDSDETASVLTLELMNRVLQVDKVNKQVIVQAGITIGALLEILHQEDLTLENLTSINWQQLGGLCQVGAHGTGAKLPPCDEQILAFTLVTPAEGLIRLAQTDQDPTYFNVAKVALGSLGVVTELTLRCIDKRNLCETVEVWSRREVRKGHWARLAQNRHVTYRWIPYTDWVVVVMANFTDQPAADDTHLDQRQAFWVAPLLALLAESGGVAENHLLATLRSQLLTVSPLDWNHVARVNQAEAEYWKRRMAFPGPPSSRSPEQILTFDCGGSQLVYEVAFPVEIGTGADLEFVDKLLDLVESTQLAAPAPVEQRWSKGSSSLLSPAGPFHGVQFDLFSWVGVVLYRPSGDAEESKKLDSVFAEYKDVVQRVSCDMSAAIPFVATHWAKLEITDPSTVQKQIQHRYPVELFNAARIHCDPKGILENKLIRLMFAGGQQPVQKNPLFVNRPFI
jgi:L-galactono-1,4-lactone dehydrogenase